MEKGNQSRRKELAVKLLSELKEIYCEMEKTAQEVEKTSGVFYEQAYEEKHGELEAVMESYRTNVNRIREINKEITAAINSWYNFTKEEKEIGKLFFPLMFTLKKKSLYKKIKMLNGEISSITINNRFVKEQLTVLEHQLEIRAISLARSGSNFLEYEKLMLKQKAVAEELKYLLPTITGTCPADIGSSAIDRLIMKIG